MKTPIQQELWMTVYDWLQRLNVHPSKTFCREEMTAHPDYPSLLSAADFLNTGSMAYQAVRADESYIHEFVYPLIAHIREPADEYMHIIAKASDWDESKAITQFWTGIVLYAEPGATWKNPHNEIYVRRGRRNQLASVLFSLVGLGCLTTAFVHSGSLLLLTFGLLSLFGLVTSFYLLGAELGFQSRVVKQVCGAVGGAGGCDHVLKSKYAKGFLGITPADASLLYFSMQFLFFVLGSWRPLAMVWITSASLTGLLAAGWSLFTQAVRLRQWCALCLAVASVLVAQTAVAAVFLQTNRRVATQFPAASWIQVISFYGGSVILLSLILFSIKSLLKTNAVSQQQLMAFRKWKTDGSLFLNLWEQEEEVNTDRWENELVIGRQDPNDDDAAPLQITVACNPYCNPCAQAHLKLEDLIRKYPGKIQAQVRFLSAPSDKMNRITIAVTAILQRAGESKSIQENGALLSDWFLWMDYDKWVDKWRPPHSVNVDDQLKSHAQWLEDSLVAFTPTFFLNGRKIPGRYDLDDLDALVPQLAESYSSKLEVTA